MPKLQALKTDDELAAVPISQPVLVELPASVSFDADNGDNDADKSRKPDAGEDDGSRRLADDLAALKAQTEAANARADQAERDRQEAIRVAAERERENEELRASRQSDETVIINNGLAAAQAERDAALAEYERAAEAGDFKAQGLAQSKIGRAEAKILNYESGAAELAERREVRKEPQRPQQQTPDFAASVRANPNLLQSEKEWMIKHQDQFKDPDFNKRLDAAYIGATNQAGLVRGSQEYFDFIEVKSGLKKPAQKDNGDDERDINVSAPPSRNERGGDGRVTNGKIMLSPGQREIARSMGVSDIEYARQVANFDQARRADPAKYGDR